MMLLNRCLAGVDEEGDMIRWPGQKP